MITSLVGRRLAARIALVATLGASLVGLSATGANADTQHRAIATYRIIVHTANIPNAGTDATIKMMVYGTLNTSPGYVNLDNKVYDDFEQNATDNFGPFSWFDIGRPDFIGVFKDSNGDEWYPDYARVLANGTWYLCPMNDYYYDGAETKWFDCP